MYLIWSLIGLISDPVRCGSVCFFPADLRVDSHEGTSSDWFLCVGWVS